MRRHQHRRSAVLGLVLLAACGGSAPSDGETTTNVSEGPPTAQRAVHEQFLEDLRTERHVSDGGGSARLILADGEDGSVVAGTSGRWTFEFVAGEHGIAEGGALFLLVPPFWGWSTPQPRSATHPGYTTATTSAEGVQLALETVDRNLLRIGIAARALAPGEAIELVYGAGELGARADDYAESRSPFWFKVDGDGDGVSELVNASPTIEILPGPPARLTATLTSTAPIGGEAYLTLAVLDVMASTGCHVSGRVALQSQPAGLALPDDIEFEESDGGTLRVPLRAPVPGLFRVRAHFESDGLEITSLSNPLRVGDGLAQVLWGDLHGHSSHSDGTGTPRAYYAYARDVAGLDFAVLTDHDHFGVRFLDANPEIWEEIQGEVDAFDEPGRFVALLGYEWTSWLYGHRHVVYFEGEGEVLTSVGGTTTTPRELWDALAGRAALTFAHHSAGAPVATDWSFQPDPVLEPVTEVMSVHGSSEAADSPSGIRGGIPGNYVRDQLERGLRLGFVGSGDSHDGHPGHAHLSPLAGYRTTRPDPSGRRPPVRLGNGGLAAVRAKQVGAQALLEAFRARQTYATSGPRILLEVGLEGHRMGSTFAASELKDPAQLTLRVAGTAEIERVEVIRRGAPIVTSPGNGLWELGLATELTGLTAGDFVYVRVVQRDGGLAWSSPFFIE